jgi:hypothetical protein
LSDGDACIICNGAVAGILTERLPCGHMFHMLCLHKWLKQSPHCPNKCEGKSQQIVYDAEQLTYTLAAAGPEPDSQDTTTDTAQHDAAPLISMDQAEAKVLQLSLSDNDKPESVEEAVLPAPPNDDATPVRKLGIGDAVIANFGEASITALYPNGNFDVKMSNGDVVENVLSYCVWTKAQNDEGLLSFETFKSTVKRNKPNKEATKPKEKAHDLSKAKADKLLGKMKKFFEGENIARMKRYWPEASLLSSDTFCFEQELVDSRTSIVPRCKCCSMRFHTVKASNLYKHFKSAKHMLAQMEQRGLSAAANAPSGVKRTTQLADAQHIARVKSAYHALKHPSVSIRAGGDNLEFAQSVFQDLDGLMSDADKQLRNLGVQLPEFSRLAREYKVLMSTAHDVNVQSCYFDILTEFFHEERIAEMRKAITHLALYLDESTDISTTAHMLLCVTFIDSDGKFRDELMEIFDVSDEGATVGAALEDRVYKFLRQHSILEKIDASFVDGASNVCDYPSRGHTLSYAALQKKRLEAALLKVLTWWCLAHRYNLALGDVLKSTVCIDIVKCLRLLVAFTRTSSYSGHVDAEAAELRKSISEADAILPDLDAQIAGLMGQDEEQRNAAFQRELDALVAQKNESKLGKQDFENKLKILGRKHKLKSYMVVRWLSLFDTVDSIVSQFSIVGAILLKKAQPFQAKIDSKQVDLNTSILLVERVLFSTRKTSGHENDEAEADAESDEAIDEAVPPEEPAPAGPKIPTRELFPGEKAYFAQKAQ